MKKENIKFRNLPDRIKYGLTLVIFSWFFFLISHSVYTGKVSLIHLTMGMFICFAALSLKNWGRILTIVYNLFMAVMIGIELYYSVKSGQFISIMLMCIKIISIVLFIISSLLFVTLQRGKFYELYRNR